MTEITFASEEDREGFEFDLMTFGNAFVDDEGKHIPIFDVVLGLDHHLEQAIFTAP